MSEQEHEKEQEEMGESTDFDEDSGDESEEDGDEETEEDRAFINDEDDLEEEDGLSFYRRVDLQLPQRRPEALPAASCSINEPFTEKKGNDC